MRARLAIGLLSVLTIGISLTRAQTRPNNDPVQPATAGFSLTSTDLKNSTFAMPQIMNSFGCSGGNISPQLSWRGAPQGSKSFVLTMFDPDAPTGSGFWHWIVVNLPAAATGLPTGASRTNKMPGGALETKNDTGTTGYAGPCPPAGAPAHRYIFTLFAMKLDKLDVSADSSGAVVGFNTRANALGAATLTAKYGR
jgi:Raf kinase inhibitor-like YbhB/YbcL family protein